MKKILALAFVAMMSIGAMAQTAQQVLDKTAAVIGNKGGASANFKMSSSKYGSASGPASHRLVQRQDPVDLSKENQRGECQQPYTGSADVHEPLYLY